MYYKRKALSIYYEIIGRGKPILMIHGFPLDHRLMKGCLEPIFRKKPGWKRVYIDLPGMGRSKGPFMKDADEMLEALLEILSFLLPDQCFAVAGESYGTHLAGGLVHELQDRVSGLLLICPVVHASLRERRVPSFEVRRRDVAFMKKLNSNEKQEFETMAVVQTEGTWKRFQREIAPGLRLRDVAFCDRFFKTGYGLTPGSEKPDAPFKGPVLILTGRQDHVVGYEDAWKLLPLYPHASFAVLDVAGHGLQIEQPMVFDSLVLEWLDRMKFEASC